MTTHTFTTGSDPRAVRQWNRAIGTLCNAEELVALLQSGDQANPLVAEALASARHAVEWAERRLEEVQERWSPEACGLED